MGKSTISAGLAAAWRDEGLNVAVLDLDPQAGVTLALNVAPPADPLSAAGTAVHGFTLWPSSRGLARATAAQIRKRLDAAARSADVVVVDLAPGLSDAGHEVALPAGTPVLVVARLDAAGLPNLAEAVALAEGRGATVRVVPSMLATTSLSREALAFIRGRYGERVTTAVVPTDARAAEAPGRGAPVLDTAPRAKVSGALRALAAEVLGSTAVPAGAGA